MISNKICRLRAREACRIVALSLLLAAVGGAGVVCATETLNGTWVLNESDSDSLKDVMNEVRREWQNQDDQIREYEQRKSQKPSVFGRNNTWDERRARSATSPIPKLMRQMVSSQTIKIYYSRKLAISYDGELKRLLQPNPDGRVYSATGSGLTKDSLGETLSYIEDGVLYIETRMSSGRLVERIDPVVLPGRLVIDWKMKAPAVERTIEMTTVYDG